MKYNDYFNNFINDEDDAAYILRLWDDRCYNILYTHFGVDELAENEGINVEIIMQSLDQWLVEKEDSLREYVGEK